MTEKTEQCLRDWIERETLAESMIPLIGQLYRNNNVITSIYGRGLINRSVIAILKAHRSARHRVGNDDLQVRDTYPVIEAMSKLDLGAASVDLGKLAVKYKAEGNGRSMDEFVRAELADVVGKRSENKPQGTDVVLYGFGRIGRLLARILVDRVGAGDGLRLRAVVVRKGADNDLMKRASLLRRDSVHGSFKGTIVVDEENNALNINGNLVKFIYSNDPTTVDYTQYGIKDALLVDNTGRWRDVEGLSQHLNRPGIARVLLTAPGKGDMKNRTASAIRISPTKTNHFRITFFLTIVPVLKTMNDKFGIVNGHVETVPLYQRPEPDRYNYKGSRGHAAALVR